MYRIKGTNKQINIYIYIYINIYMSLVLMHQYAFYDIVKKNSTAQLGGRKFEDRKPIGKFG